MALMVSNSLRDDTGAISSSLLIEIAFSHVPFIAISATYKKIAQGKFKIPSFVSSDAGDLIRKLLQNKPEDRMSLVQVATHPWILKNQLKNAHSRLE